MNKGLVCIFKGHLWSFWTHWTTENKDYKFCYRCGKQEFRRVEPLINKGGEGDDA